LPDGDMLERKKGGGVRQLEPEVLEGCGACGEGSIGVVEQGKVARHETLIPSCLLTTTLARRRRNAAMVLTART
jgi:hypothetical protein